MRNASILCGVPRKEVKDVGVITVKNERLAAQDVYSPCVGLKCSGWGRGEADICTFVTCYSW